MDKRRSNNGKKNGIILKESSASQRKRINERCSRYIKRVDLQFSRSQNGTEPGYVVNLKRFFQAQGMHVWAVHFFTFENVGQNYDVLSKLI